MQYLNIEIYKQKAWQGAYTINKRDVSRIVNIIFELLSVNIKKRKIKIILNIMYVNDTTIKSYNCEYRNKNTPTDVLSFSNISHFSEIKDIEENSIFFLGDIVLSYETILRDSLDLRKPFNEYLLYIFIHGLLHLFGYDHKSDLQELEMEEMSNKTLNLFNRK